VRARSASSGVTPVTRRGDHDMTCGRRADDEAHCRSTHSLPRVRPMRLATPLADPAHAWSKVPEVTLLFWVLEVGATTLGETGGDALSR